MTSQVRINLPSHQEIDYYYNEAKSIHNRETFQGDGLYGSFLRLQPIAKQYVETVKKTKQFGIEFLNIHNKFKTVFNEEYCKAFSDTPDAVIAKYPKLINLFLTAFLQELPLLSPTTYKSWESKAMNSDPEILEIYPYLAERRVLENLLSKSSGPGTLLESYRQFEDKKTLSALLRREISNDENSDAMTLCHRIRIASSKYQEKLTKKVYNAFLQVINGEVQKYFTLLEKMGDLSSMNLDQRYRAVFLALLKQDAINQDVLPLSFRTEGLENDLLTSAHALYQKLSPFEKKEFETLFLRSQSGEKFSELEDMWSAISPHIDSSRNPIDLLVYATNRPVPKKSSLANS